MNKKGVVSQKQDANNLELQPGCQYQIKLYHQIIWPYQQVDKRTKRIQKGGPKFWNPRPHLNPRYPCVDRNNCILPILSLHKLLKCLNQTVFYRATDTSIGQLHPFLDKCTTLPLIDHRPLDPNFLSKLV